MGWQLTSTHPILKLSHKKRKNSLEDSLERVLFTAKLEFSKILVPKLPQNSSKKNIECAGKSKQLYSIFSLYDQLLAPLAPLREQLQEHHYTGASHCRKNIAAVITQDRVIDEKFGNAN